MTVSTSLPASITSKLTANRLVAPFRLKQDRHWAEVLCRASERRLSGLLLRGWDSAMPHPSLRPCSSLEGSYLQERCITGPQ